MNAGTARTLKIGDPVNTTDGFRGVVRAIIDDHRVRLMGGRVENVADLERVDLVWREIMWAEQTPDVYDGPDCDQHRPLWLVSAEGDKDSPSPQSEPLELKAEHFPAGTKVVVSVPGCPNCDEGAGSGHDVGADCECGFSWRRWTGEQFS